jgi:hypothetical protein
MTQAVLFYATMRGMRGGAVCSLKFKEKAAELSSGELTQMLFIFDRIHIGSFVAPSETTVFVRVAAATVTDPRRSGQCLLAVSLHTST